MRFAASLEVELPADVVERSPTLWDTCRSLLGAPADLRTPRVRTRMEAATFLHQVRSALDALGVDNARFLLVDGSLVFEDARGTPHDLTDLMIAFTDHVLVASESCRELRLCVEHDEAGFHLEIEARFAVEHEAEHPAALVSVLGRVVDFAPRANESAEAYRLRIAPLVSDPRPLAGLKLQFGMFVSRLEQALATALPGASTRVLVRSLGIDGDSMGESPPSRRPDRDSGVGAAMEGPAASVARLKSIEDLRESVLDALALAERESLDAVPVRVEHDLERLNRLVEEHNLAYPIERNLPLDAATGAFLLNGEPWSPTAPVTIEDLRRETAARRRAAAKA